MATTMTKERAKVIAQGIGRARVQNIIKGQKAGTRTATGSRKAAGGDSALKQALANIRAKKGGGNTGKGFHSGGT